jgi:hypothetical protein
MNTKEIADILVIPVTICVIGVWATFRATDTQNKNAKELADSQYELSEKHHAQDVNLQVTNEFFRLLETSDVCKSSGRIEFVIGEATPKRATALKQIFIDHCKQEGTKELEQITESASTAVNDAKIKEIDGLIADLQGTGRRVARTRLMKLYEENELLVAQQFANSIKEDFNNYRTTLGILVVLSSVEGGWTQEGDLLKELERLENSPNMKDRTFKKTYNDAKDNKAKRYHVVVVSATKEDLAKEFKERLISEGFEHAVVFKTSKGYGVSLGVFPYQKAKDLQFKFEGLERFHPNYPNKADLYETKPSIVVLSNL